MKYLLFSKLYKYLAKPVFFMFDPEDMHDFFTSAGEFLGKYSLLKKLTKSAFRYDNKFLVQKVSEVKFSNPIGLAAGFDKDARLTKILPDVGFGFETIGTVTQNAYSGNPKPRLHRLPNSRGIVVNYGLKNIGAEKIVNNIKKIKHEFPIIVSIGKTNAKYTSKGTAGIKDYYDCMLQFEKANIGDIYEINISCPNTFGGEPFTTPAKLDKLLSQLKKIRTTKPVFIKMPINLSWRQFDSLLKITVKYKFTGVTIGNLNKDHKDKLIVDNLPKMKGGISGKPTEKLSNELIRKTYEKYRDKLIIIGVGGVFSANDAYEKIKCGASLVALITGIIYEGPQLIGQINKELVKLMKTDGFSNITEAVGSYYRD
ncbi:quinone-dependent dihydroorotate dehydrogenase [Candidatus Microgenomates bacterium]|nr:MAG: quinone-dependent dihydroorotate dehydrogenase [Candidatus Microgenomates bacterium]